VIDVAVEISAGKRITGTVSGVFGQTLVHTNFGQVNHKRRFRAWLMLLLLAAARPSEEFTAVALGRKGHCRFGPLDPAQAHASLCDLIELYELGLCEPLPIASKTSFEYAAARRKGAAPAEAVKAAMKGWDGSRWGGECREPEHEHVYGKRPAFAVLLGAEPNPGDGRDRWPDEPTRFGVLSRRWWDPMLEGEAQASA
jgi:exodeoxyribonuclease V gamma subunit